MNVPPHRPCPDDEVLEELAAGISSPELAEQTVQHAAQCKVCGPALKRYLQEFSTEETPENTRILQQLQSSKAEWRRRLIREAAAPRRRAPWLKLVPVFAALAVALLTILEGPSLVTEYKIRQAQKQVASAFTGRRTTEMRIASVDYARYTPFPIILGSESGRSLDEFPPALHDASSAATEHLKSTHPDPRWLQIQGRALLWEATPSSLAKAEKNFENARAEGLNSPSLEIDLAATYFERDSKSDHPNLQRSLDLLNRVLSTPKLSDSDRASALYNLAIAYEKTQAWDMAVATWEKYLQVDASSSWANEATQHLKNAKSKAQKPAPRSALDPADFLQQQGTPAMKDRFEEYLDVALTAWLPDALENQNTTAWTATQKLADILVHQHQDFWLADLLSSLNRTDVPAVKALAVAIQENGGGDHARALEAARDAARMFRQRKNLSGEFRAEIEEVNALRRSLNGADCLARADPLLTRLTKTRYYWLQARFFLEKAECGNLVGAFAESDSSLTTSREIAARSDFALLVLRDIGISAGNQHLRGNCNESWQESVRGLNLYWQRTFSSDERLYQFYSVMFQCALETGSLYAGEAFVRHAIAMRRGSHEIRKNANIEGVLHLELANILIARGAGKEAEQEKQKASELLRGHGLPNKFKLIVDLEPAEFQLQQGDAQSAMSTLQPLGKLLVDNPDSFFSLRYHQSLGMAQLKLGQLEQAAVSYEKAINTAESALNNIKNWVERLQWLRATDDSYRGLVRVLIEQKKPREALEQWELYRSKSLLAQLKTDAQAASEQKSAHLQKSGFPLLSSGTETRIIYAQFNDGIQIWISRAGEIHAHWTSVEKQDVEEPARQFIEMCANENSRLSDLQRVGKNLFSLLLEPVIEELPSSGNLIIELDPGVYDLPMEALPGPDGRYFGEKYSLVYSPGIWMEKALRSPRAITGHETLMLLDASHAAGTGYLPGFESQRNTILRFFPRAQVVDSFKTGWQVTREQLGSAQLFHYMGHGRPDGSGTSLDYDARQSLRANDFAPAVLSRTELVVLAACSGGAGRDYGMADTSNLIHAFLNAGVPNIIASHWNVDASFTSQLMDSFYQHLAKNETVAQAMYNARVDMLRANPHPYYWAGFSLSGRIS